MIVDRRSREWDSVRAVLSRVVTLFPARIREVGRYYHIINLNKPVQINLSMPYNKLKA